MNYSAQDIALIITTVTTAVTAIGGLLLPSLSARRNQTSVANKEIHQQFRQALDAFVVEIMARQEALQANIFETRKASRSVAAGFPYEMTAAKDKFDLAATRLRLMGDSYGIDTTDILRLGTTLTALRAAYWEATADGRQVDTQRLLAKAVVEENSYQEELGKQVKAFWDKVRANYPTT